MVKIAGTAAAALLAAAALAGCGSAAQAPVPVSHAATAAAGPGVPAAGSRDQALRLAREMLGRVVLPPGAKPAALPVPPLLAQPDIWLAEGDSVEVYGFWAAPAPVAAVMGFLAAHPPAGLASQGYGTGGTGAGMTVQRTDYALGSVPAGIYDARLALLVGPGQRGGSLLRAIVQVGWYPPRSAAEHVPAGVRAVIVSATVLGSEPRTVTRTFTAATTVLRFASLVNAMPAAPRVAVGCPLVRTTYQVVFRFAPGGPDDIVASVPGCLTVQVTAAGRAQPALDDPGDRLAALAATLLGLPQPTAAPTTAPLTGIGTQPPATAFPPSPGPPAR